jgi:pyruvate/2-oxoglutarate/acetoin dehydrogenase E1 component
MAAESSINYNVVSARPAGQTRISIRMALNEALAQEMRRDSRIIILGEDISGGMGAKGEQDTWGGPLGVTKGLMPEFGRERVMDTPLQESAIIGAACGAASNGLRPVAELMFINFIGVCMDQFINQVSKFRYMFGGKLKTPVTIRTVYGAGLRVAAQHSNSYYSLVTHLPGLKVVMPSNAYDAKGLLIASIRDDDPVIFCEHLALYDDECEVPSEPYVVPLGEANLTREGKDATIVAMGRMVKHANTAADKLKADGIRCTVVDPRTLSPLDEDTILEAVEETGRLVVVDEATPRCSMATDISALAASRAFGSLKAPIKMVTAPHTPVPFAPALEDAYLPTPEKIEAAVREVMGYRR